MENASKALLIAASILFAMIVLGLLLYLFNAMNIMGQADEESKLIKQISEFNAEYEAYNKQIMYGTDVITLVNKAIDNNIKVDRDEMRPYYVDVTLTIDNDYQTMRKVDTLNTTTGKREYGSASAVGGAVEFRGGYKYTLRSITDTSSQDNFRMDPKFVQFFAADVHDSIDETESGGILSITYTFSALTQFKRSTFTCEEMEYDQENGRIKHIRIKERKQVVF